MMSRILKSFAILLLLAPLTVSAQDRYAQIAIQYSPSKVYYEALTLKQDDATSIIISFRFPNDKLVFLHNTQNSENGKFISNVNMTVELYKDGEPYKTEIWEKTHYASSFDETRDRNIDLEGLISFDIDDPAGRYSYRLVFEDKNAEGEAQSGRRPINLPDSDSLAIFDAFMAFSYHAIDNNVTSLDLINLSGDIAFGKHAIAAIPFTLPEGVSPKDATISYKIRQFSAEQAPRRLNRRRRSSDEAAPTNNNPAGGEVIKEGTVSFESAFRYQFDNTNGGSELNLNKVEDGNNWIAFLELDSQNFSNARFVLDLTLKVGEEETEVHTKFNSHWRNMPASLWDLEIAIRNLEFIQPKDAVKAMLKLDSPEQEETFLAFWKERDPTPDSEFNELFAEYYRRVDYAAYEYRTGGTPIPNGLKTDRARVYIQNGPPIEMKREFPSRGRVHVIWLYANGRQFTFEGTNSLDTFDLVSSTKND